MGLRDIMGTLQRLAGLQPEMLGFDHVDTTVYAVVDIRDLLRVSLSKQGLIEFLQPGNYGFTALYTVPAGKRSVIRVFTSTHAAGVGTMWPAFDLIQSMGADPGIVRLGPTSNGDFNLTSLDYVLGEGDAVGIGVTQFSVGEFVRCFVLYEEFDIT